MQGVHGVRGTVVCTFARRYRYNGRHASAPFGRGVAPRASQSISSTSVNWGGVRRFWVQVVSSGYMRERVKSIIGRIPRRTRRVLVGFVGWAVLLLGIVMIPYPGPGWVVVFIALSILASEFDWAKGVNASLRARYDDWRQWLTRQALYIKVLFWVLTAVTVVVTIWLLNGYGLMNQWLHLGQDWVTSPLFRR